MLTLVAMVDIGLMGTSLLDIRMLNVSTDSTILSVGIVMLFVVHLLVSPTVNVMSSSSGVKSTSKYPTHKTLIMAGKMPQTSCMYVPPVAVSTLVATVTTVSPVAGGSNDTHTWSSPPSFTLADMDGSNVASKTGGIIIYYLNF